MALATKNSGDMRLFWWFCCEEGDGNNVVAFLYGDGNKLFCFFVFFGPYGLVHYN